MTDSAANISQYENDGGKTDSNCLVRWKPDGTSPEWMTGGGDALCNGTAHGLKLVAEGGTEYLYHANNNQKLTKTTLDGTVVWQRNGYFGQDPQSKYRPTWWALPPDSKHAYLCDGYGSNHVYVHAFSRATGEFTNRTFGGQGDRSQHGKFSTNHGCTYDPRNGKIAVSDRANSRFEYFDYDKDDPDKFDYAFTVDMQPSMGAGTLPCNLRMYPDQDGRAISPDLAGPVAVLDASNTVISVVNVSGLLAADHHDHPHDAIFLPNGDMVVATWNPGGSRTGRSCELGADTFRGSLILVLRPHGALASPSHVQKRKPTYAIDRLELVERGRRARQVRELGAERVQLGVADEAAADGALDGGELAEQPREAGDEEARVVARQRVDEREQRRRQRATLCAGSPWSREN